MSALRERVTAVGALPDGAGLSWMPATATGAAPVKEADHRHHRALELLVIVLAIGLLFGPNLHQGSQPNNSHATQEPGASRPREG